VFVTGLRVRATVKQLTETTMRTKQIKARLEQLRGVLRSESISYGELAELQSLAPYIEPWDVELLEPAGVPEFPNHQTTNQND